MEIWKDIKGYEGLYMVSNYGNVKSLSREVFKKMYGGKIHPYLRKERIKRPDKSSQGYLTIGLSRNCNKERFKVHRLVAIAFIHNPDNKPYINHIDNNPSNNRVENLEWCTSSENTLHMIRQNRQADNLPKSRKGTQINTCKLDEDKVLQIRRSTLSNSKLGKIYGVSKSAIRFIKIKKNWAHV